MEQNFAVKLDKPISNAVLINAGAATAMDSAVEQSNSSHDVFLDQLRSQTAEISQQQSRFKAVVDNLAHLKSDFFKQQKENIVKLSVAIAERILAQKIQQNDYSIEKIITQAIDNTPAAEDMVIRLNPQDYSMIAELIKSPDAEFAKGVSFVSDAKIRPAECILETQKGIIELFIDEQLEKIAEELKKTV